MNAAATDGHSVSEYFRVLFEVASAPQREQLYVVLTSLDRNGAHNTEQFASRARGIVGEEVWSQWLEALSVLYGNESADTRQAVQHVPPATRDDQ